MESFSKKISKKEIDYIIKKYSSLKVESNNPYVVFFAKVKGCTVTIYTSDKILITGLNINNLEIIEFLNSSATIDEEAVGSDETGTGDLFGPIVVTAVKLIDGNRDFLKGMSIGDSKKIPDFKIEEYYLKIIKNVESKTMVISPSRYNEMMKISKNIKSIISYGHYKCQNEIETNGKRIIDQFVGKEVFFKYLGYEAKNYENWIFETKSEDKYIQVALASIIARYKLIEWFKLQKEKGIELSKGGNFSEREILLMISKVGKENISNFAKIDFKNIKNLI